MILPVFALLLAVAVAFVALGLRTQEHTELAVIGFLFLLLLAVVLLGDNLEVVVGTNTTVLDNVTTLERNHYEAYPGQSTYGWWLALMAGVSLAILLWNLGRRSDE